MKVLFDQGTPVPLRTHFTSHHVSTAYELGWSTLKNGELLAAAESNGPGGISYGSGGSGTSVHLAAEMFQVQAGVKLLHVPYRGTSLAVTGLMSGDTDLMFDTTPSAFPKIKSGQLRSFGITSSNRAPDLPDVPTVAEQGLPNYEVLFWLGLYAPKGTSPDILQLLESAIQKILAQENVKKNIVNKFKNIKDITKETAECADVIKRAGVVLE